MCFKETGVWASRSHSEGWPVCTAKSFSSTGLMRALARIQFRWQRHLTTYQMKWFKLYWSVQRPASACIDFLVFCFQFHWFFILSLLFSLFCLLCVYFSLFSDGPSIDLQVSVFWCMHLAFQVFSWCCFSCIPWILIHIQSNILFLSIFFRT